MAFRATNILPVDALRDAKRLIVSVRRDAVRYKAQFESSGANSQTILGVLAGLGSAHQQLLTLSATPGIVQFAKDQENDQAYDVAGEFTALLALMVDAATALAQAIPKSGGYLLANTLDANGFQVPREFVPADLVAVVSALDDLILAIE
jgi:hypothetical protein